MQHHTTIFTVTENNCQVVHRVVEGGFEMIHTLKGGISIEITTTLDKHHKKKGIVFNYDDTLKSAMDLLKASQQLDPEASNRFQLLQTKEESLLRNEAIALGGCIGDIRFDNINCVLLCDVIDVTDNSKIASITQVVSREYQFLNENMGAYMKCREIRTAYHLKFKSMLNQNGIFHILLKDLNKALKWADYDLEGAFDYAIENIYTPLKLIMSTRWLIREDVRALKFQRNDPIKKDLLTTVTDTKLASPADKEEIDARINKLHQKYLSLSIEADKMKEELIFKLTIEGEINTRKVMNTLSHRMNWNIDATYIHVSAHRADYI